MQAPRQPVPGCCRRSGTAGRGACTSQRWCCGHVVTYCAVSGLGGAHGLGSSSSSSSTPPCLCHKSGLHSLQAACTATTCGGKCECWGLHETRLGAADADAAPRDQVCGHGEPREQRASADASTSVRLLQAEGLGNNPGSSLSTCLSIEPQVVARDTTHCGCIASSALKTNLKATLTCYTCEVPHGWLVAPHTSSSSGSSHSEECS